MVKEHDDIDLLEFIEIIAKFRGQQCGVVYAEGFKKASIWQETKPERFLP